MSRKLLKGANPAKWSRLNTLFAFAFLVVAMLFCDVQAARALPVGKVMAIPAFARKYGLPCSACHTAWPELNNFGQIFPRQRLSIDERPRFTDLAKPLLLPDRLPHHAKLAP